MSIPTPEEIRAAPTSDLLRWLLTLHEEGSTSEQLRDRILRKHILAEIDLRIPVPR